jgi:hypothetical protein
MAGIEKPSPRKREANRQNAKLSSGPKTLSGKARSSRNARKHGLAALHSRPPALLEQCYELAARIAGGEEPDPFVLAHAFAVAEAETELTRIKRIRRRIIGDALSKAKRKTPPPTTHAAKEIGELHAASEMRHVAKLLLGLDRYERRVRAQRKRAMRSLSP